MEINYNISVIIPVYNAEKHLKRCIDCLFRQTLKNIEYIFIDDCSTDDSYNLLNKLVDRNIRDDLKIIIKRHSLNRGAAATRNTGLELASGKYIGWVDADDYIEDNMLEALFNHIESKNADIVYCNFTIDYGDRKVDNNLEEITDTKEFLRQLIQVKVQGNIWNKLFKHQIIKDNHIQFIEGNNLGEDRNFLVKNLYYATSICHLKQSLYYYAVSDSNSITRKLNMASVYQDIANSEDICKFIDREDPTLVSPEELNYFKFNTKLKLLMSINLDDFRRWKNIFPESNEVYKNYSFSRRIKFLAYNSSRGNWLLVKLFILIKMIIKSVRR